MPTTSSTPAVDAHPLCSFDELLELRASQQHLDEIMDILLYSNVTADSVVKSMLADKFKEIRAGQKRAEPRGSDGQRSHQKPK